MTFSVGKSDGNEKLARLSDAFINILCSVQETEMTTAQLLALSEVS